MRGTKENREAKAVPAFEGAGGCDFRTNGGWLGENVLSMDEVFFDPLSDVVVAGLGGGGEGVSGNSCSKPTGTRFRS